MYEIRIIFVAYVRKALCTLVVFLGIFFFFFVFSVSFGGLGFVYRRIGIIASISCGVVLHLHNPSSAIGASSTFSQGAESVRRTPVCQFKELSVSGGFCFSFFLVEYCCNPYWEACFQCGFFISLTFFPDCHVCFS
jgi:hypothetical protein